MSSALVRPGIWVDGESGRLVRVKAVEGGAVVYAGLTRSGAETLVRRMPVDLFAETLPAADGTDLVGHEFVADAYDPAALAGQGVWLPARFHLVRDVDVTGVSGTGVVADGVVWPDETVSIRWRGDKPSTVFWGSLVDAYAIHGHGGHTRFAWLD